MNPRRHILAIETSNPSAFELPAGGEGLEGRRAIGSMGVALGILLAPDAPPVLLGVEPIHAASGRDALMPTIQTLCAKHNVRPRDLARIGISIGPGGFTPVRIAVVAAKMIAEATGAQVVGVPTANALALRLNQSLAHAPTLDNPQRLAILLASKRDSAHITIAQREGPTWTCPNPGRVMTAAELAPLNVQAIVCDAHAPATFAATPSLPQCYDPAAVLEACMKLPSIDPADLLPLYPREPEAVTKWRELGRERAKGS